MFLKCVDLLQNITSVPAIDECIKSQKELSNDFYCAFFDQKFDHQTLTCESKSPVLSIVQISIMLLIILAFVVSFSITCITIYNNYTIMQINQHTDICRNMLTFNPDAKYTLKQVIITILSHINDTLKLDDKKLHDLQHLLKYYNDYSVVASLIAYLNINTHMTETDIVAYKDLQVICNKQLQPTNPLIPILITISLLIFIAIIMLIYYGVSVFTSKHKK